MQQGMKKIILRTDYLVMNDKQKLMKLVKEFKKEAGQDFIDELEELEKCSW